MRIPFTSFKRSIMVCLLFFGRLGAVELAPVDRVDWPVFMARHDMIWEKLPEKPRDAPHFGNGLVGSMLFADARKQILHLQVFRSDVSDHRDDSWGGAAYSRPRLVIGEFQLTLVGKLTGCRLRQDLWNAELTGSITTDKGSIQLRHFVHADDLAIATEIKPDAGEQGCAWSWHPAVAATTRAGLPITEADRQAYIKRYGEKWRDTKLWVPNPVGRQEQRGDVTVWIQDLLAGGQYATAWEERTGTDGIRTSIISIGNSFPERTAADAAAGCVAACQSKPAATWRDAHQRWWHDYYRQSFLSIPDTRLESAYWGSVFRWAASARAGRGYMDTSGIWFQGGGWPYTTMNFNLQSCLWGVYAANRLNVGGSLVEALKRNEQALIENVSEKDWRGDSAFVARAVAPDFRGGSNGGKPGEPEVGLLPWTLHNAWLQYRYSMDESILRDTVYPLLRRAVNYYRHLSQDGADGRIHLPETFSPEKGAFPDCNFDLSLCRWGVETLVWSAARLKIDDPLIPVWKDLLARLAPFPIDEMGFRFGASLSFDGSHRHASHLLMIYPLSVITTDQPEWREAIRTSAQSYAACDSRLLAMAGLQGAPIAAVSGFPELAYHRIQWHNDDLSPAGFGDSSGWCMEGAVAIANSIQMLMLQSHGDRIRVFPSMPTEWTDAVFRDLRAEGAFLVSARREGGRTRWVQVTSMAGEPCRVEPGLTGKARVMGGRQGVKLTERGNGVYDLSLKKGQSVVLAGDDAPGPIAVDALSAQPALSNTFGLNAVGDAYRAARVQECFTMLKNSDPLMEWAGVMVIGVLGNAEDAKSLLRAAPGFKGTKAKGALREALSGVLARDGNALRPALRAALGDPALRGSVLPVLAERGNPEDLAALSRTVGSVDIATQRQVFKALAARRNADLCPVLKPLLESTSDEALRKEIFLTFIASAKNQDNPAIRAKIVEQALPLMTDEAMKKQLQELLPTP